jgi:PIN domain nuclease of toxin-antitoxin system
MHQVNIEEAKTYLAALIDPYHHRDPFVRLLIAHAMAARMRIVSAEPFFDPYSVMRLC